MDAQCLPDAIYDLIIGNVPGTRPADEPDPFTFTWNHLFTKNHPTNVDHSIS